MNIRSILERNGIQVWDSGPNTPKGQISIHCPLCGPADPSHHMALSPIGEIYCFRNKKHGGRNLVRLFRKLGIPTSEYEHLNINQSIVPIHHEVERHYDEWVHFKPAYESEEAIEYLKARLFTRPVDVAKQFNLKVSLEGKWAGRLIIPLNIGWTARSMRAHIEPRYLSNTSVDGFFFYSQGSSSLILCEGALDCMRVVSVSKQYDVAAKGRIDISPALFNFLREKKYSSIISVPDSTVPFSQRRDELDQLRSYCPNSDVKQLLLLKKDFGAMNESITRKTLGELYGRKGVYTTI